MKVLNFSLSIVAMLLLSSCSDPYFSMSGDSQLMIENDISILETYANTLCSIKEMQEREEISRGKCLAMYYDKKEHNRVEKEVTKRVSYILSNPAQFDKEIYGRLTIITAKTADCANYINQNCM